MKNLRLALAVLWLALWLSLPASAQVPPAGGGAPELCGFASLSVTATTANVALPSVAAQCSALTVYNDGAQEAFWNTGATSAVTATTSSTPIPGGASITVYVNPLVTKYVAAIMTTGTTTLRALLGTGPIAYRSGSASGGGVAPSSVSITPTTGNLHQVTVPCGTSSGTLLAPASASIFVRLKIPLGATNTVWVNWAGAAAVTASPSDDFSGGSSITWSTVNGIVPQQQSNCISTPASQAVTLEYE